MHVSAILTPNPVSIPTWASLDDAMELMGQREIRHLPVVDGSRVVGVISDRDLLGATGWLHPAQRDALEAPGGQVGDFMHSPPVTLGPDEDVGDVLGPMLERRVGCLPVLEDGRLVGIVSELDVLREYAHACTTDRLPDSRGPRVESLATSDVVTIEPDASGDEALELLRDGGMRHVPVVEDGNLVGMVSERDLLREAGCGRLELALVSELMTANPLATRPEERLSSVARILASAKVSALPVVSGRQLVGIVTVADVLEPCAKALQTLP